MKIDVLGITGEVFNGIEDWHKDREQSCSIGEQF